MPEFANTPLLVGLMIAGLSLPHAAADTQEPTIRVTGEGTASAKPDIATITTGVTTQASTAKEALDLNNDAMAKVITAVKEFDIQPRDIQTAAFSVSPIYQRDTSAESVPEEVAYRVHNSVRVRVRELSSLGDVLDSLVKAGSNELSGISFEVADSSAVWARARRRAVRDAKSRAETYADAAGAAVGRVLRIRESSSVPPRPMEYASQMRAAASTVPIESGEREFQATVEVEYRLSKVD